MPEGYAECQIKIFKGINNMLNKIALSCCIIILVTIAYSADVTSLIGNKYRESLKIGAYEIELNKDYTYESQYGSEGLYWYNKGKYNIKNNTVYLEPNVCKEHKDDKDSIPCDRTLGKAECTIINDGKSLYYIKFLKCISSVNKNVLGFNSSDVSFPMPEFKVKSGEERVYKDVKVIVLTDSNGTTTSNVKIRKSPNINSESIKYTDKIYFDPTSKTYDFVPKDTQVNIIARTKDKVRVDKWNNYWYLINVGITDEVWMYGEFIKIK
jgi:hypothetical protein